jgi:phage/plasmid-like protein (TIGR03299 family)
MAHEIDFTTSATGSAMFANKPAWHGFGTVVQGAQTSEDALRISGLDWTVATTEVAAKFPDGTYRNIPTHRATYRTDTGAPLGAVGTRYVPLQNREAFGWMDSVVGESLAIWDTCGSLKSGRQVWMLAKLPKTIEVINNDILEQYVLITNRHDGLGAVNLFPTTVRVVCANTLRLAVSSLKAQGGLTIGLRLLHTAGSLAKRVEKARECLGVISGVQNQFGEAARVMQSKALDTQAVANYFGSLAEGKPDRTRNKLLNSLWDRFALPTNEGSFGSTIWTAYNAASEYADHELRVVGKGNVRAERKFASVLFGSAHTFKERAWALASELAV